MTRPLHGTALGTALAGAGLVLAACGGSSSSGSSAAATSPAASAAPSPAASAAPAATGTPVTVTEADFKIALSPMPTTPGTYTLKIANKGQATHALEVDGPGVSDRKSDTVSPGSSTSMTVTLQKGSYEVYCPVDGHKGLGMDNHLTIG